jgi:hypothetical protein
VRLPASEDLRRGCGSGIADDFAPIAAHYAQGGAALPSGR